MKLHFDRDIVARLLDHTCKALEHSPNYEQLYEDRYLKKGVTPTKRPRPEDIDTSKIPPGLWLVGDQGIYLMSNGCPGLRSDDTGKGALVARAFETDPDRHPDTWYGTKVAAFGGDDGCEFISAGIIQQVLTITEGQAFWIDITPDAIYVPSPAKKPAPARKPAAAKTRPPKKPAARKHGTRR